MCDLENEVKLCVWSILIGFLSFFGTLYVWYASEDIIVWYASEDIIVYSVGDI